MGQLKLKQGVFAPTFNMVVPRNSTAAIIKNRVVKFSTVSGIGNVKHTTGTSGRLALGVALGGCTGAGKSVPVQLFGVCTVVASTRAIASGAALRATSGAASTATFAGGTVRAATAAMTTALPIRANIIGYSLTSCAAAATIRTVQMFLLPTINNPFLT